MSPTMTAAVLHGARDVRIETYPRPELRPGMALLRVRRVGMCGSDLHYFQHGYCAGFVPTRPFVLGHELSAEVEAVADDVTGLVAGARVAVNPARACDRCRYCRGGRRNLCRSTVMLGSASTKPPTDGAFAQWLAIRADQCHVAAGRARRRRGRDARAVRGGAARRAPRGHLSASRVLVTGGGTIGLLAAMTARAFGAGVVVVSDVLRRAADDRPSPRGGRRPRPDRPPALGARRRAGRRRLRRGRRGRRRAPGATPGVRPRAAGRHDRAGRHPRHRGRAAPREPAHDPRDHLPRLVPLRRRIRRRDPARRRRARAISRRW